MQQADDLITILTGSACVINIKVAYNRLTSGYFYNFANIYFDSICNSQVQMCILPVETGLKDPVELGKGDPGRNSQSAPDNLIATGELYQQHKSSFAWCLGF